ncbi:MAG: 50S ribosomal protein L25 [Labilithrix sp.]|nr:50S ribosomal protein L25 [Labilithrix sp.]MBX3225107.1 50S ribosomal protein L25 [Labilithrix sp.]
MHTVAANTRTETGKGAARRLRNSGKIPAVAYGKGLAATTLSVAPKDVVTVLKSERGQNTVLQMKVEGGNELLVMIKDYTYHPVTRSLEHVDFVEVKLDQTVDVDVPLFAHGKAVGVTAGGLLRQVYRTVPVRCLPDRIPLKIDTDVSHLELGYAVATKDLKLPEGVEVRLPAEQTLVAVVAPEKDRTEEAAAAPGAAPAAAAAAPAGGKAPAAGDKKDAGKDAKKK